MKKIIYICDRCGKQISGKMHRLATMIFDESQETAEDVYDGAELCEKCYEVIDKAVMAAMQITKPEPKIKDIGKVKALKAAGWTLAKIADEFGVTPQTVANTLKRAEKEGEDAGSE